MTTSPQEPDPWEIKYTSHGPAGEVTWTNAGPVISTGASTTWNASVGKPQDAFAKRVQWPYPEKRADILPHPRRYLDKEKRTRCPDCGAVTRDPTVLLTIPCKVPTPSAREIDDECLDNVTVYEPTANYIGETWFDLSTRICWVWHSGMEEEPEWGWYDAETGRLKEEYQLLLINPSDYHPKADLVKAVLTLGRTKPPPDDLLRDDLTNQLIDKADRKGMVLLGRPTISKTQGLITAHVMGRRVFTT